MQEFTTQYSNSTSNLSLVIESNAESVWVYLLSSSGKFLKDAFLLSAIEPIAELDKEAMKSGDAPVLIKSIASETAYQPKFVESDFKVIWSETGLDAAVHFKNSPIAAIYNNQKSGYSKSLAESSGFGQPWSDVLYNEVFKSDC